MLVLNETIEPLLKFVDPTIGGRSVGGPHKTQCENNNKLGVLNAYPCMEFRFCVLFQTRFCYLEWMCAVDRTTTKNCVPQNLNKHTYTHTQRATQNLGTEFNCFRNCRRAVHSISICARASVSIAMNDRLDRQM